MNDVYPLTIIRDRYNGVYSVGAFTAFNLDPNEVPTDCLDDDVTCADFWCQNSLPVGLGATPDEAFADLVVKLKK